MLFSASRAQITADWGGFPLVRSITSVPGFAPSMIPSGPRATCSTIAEFGRDIRTMLHLEATSLGEVLDYSGVWQRHQDDAAPGGYISGRGARLRPFLQQWLHLLAADIVDHQRIAAT
jgi:hypothetical protein